jgi:hypothetical protein
MVDRERRGIGGAVLFVTVFSACETRAGLLTNPADLAYTPRIAETFYTD